MKKYFAIILLSITTTVATMYGYNKWYASKLYVSPSATSSTALTKPVSFGYQAPLSGMQDFTNAAAIATPAVVHIKNKGKVSQQSRYYQDPFKDFFGDDFFFGNPDGNRSSESSGSGVIITEDGYIVTNNHVVENAQELSVSLSDNTTLKAELIGTDPSTDIAVIKIDMKGLPHLPLANSDSVKVGQWVLAVGNPFDLESTVTAGIVSAKGRNIDINRSKSKNPIESFIQTDAAVNPGNSGGALVNLSGELIGINSAIASPTGTYAGYSFAVPTNIVEKVVDDILKFGIVQRAFLGVNIVEINDKLVAEKKLSLSHGIYVGGVVDQSGAADAGLKEGDIITHINGTKVTTSPQLLEQVAKYRPGNSVAITYNRDGKEITSNVILKNSQNNTDIVKKGSDNIINNLGATFKELDKNNLAKLGIRNGVEVTNLQDGMLKNNTGMRDGFIIMKVNNVPVSNVEELSAALNEANGEVFLSGIYPDYPKMVYYRLEL